MHLAADTREITLVRYITMVSSSTICFILCAHYNVYSVFTQEHLTSSIGIHAADELQLMLGNYIIPVHGISCGTADQCACIQRCLKFKITYNYGSNVIFINVPYELIYPKEQKMKSAR